MAFLPAPTLCEVTYDITEDEQRYTPFRYQCRSATTRANTPGGYSEVTNYSLPSGLTVTYYEYLRSLYDSRIQSAKKKSYRHCKSAQPSTGSRVGTLGSGNTHNEGESLRSGRPTTALPYVSTTYPSVAHSKTTDDLEEGSEYNADDKLVWVDALNKWIPEHQLNSRPYVSFVGTAPTVEKLYSNLREAMKKKEALRKKALEQLESRRQMKAVPPPNSLMNDRKQKVRFQTPRSTKVSPRSPRESVVKEHQDFQKSWDDEVNTEDLKKKDVTQKTDVNISSRIKTDIDTSDKDEKDKKEIKPEKSQSEIDRENARKLQESLLAKNKKEKQVDRVISKVATKDIPAFPTLPVVEAEVEEPTPPSQPPLLPSRSTRPIKLPPSDVPTRSTKGETKKVKKAPKKDSSNTKPTKTETDVKPSRPKTKSGMKVKTKNKGIEEKVDLEECGTLISEDAPPSVATIEDTKTGPLSLTVSLERVQSPEESPPPQPRRRSIVKKAFIPKVRIKSERSESTPSPVEEEEKPPTPEEVIEEPKEEIPSTEPELPHVDLDEPPLPDPSLLKSKESKATNVQKAFFRPLLKLEQKLKKQRQFKRDTSYEEELRRQEEAERRRQKQMEMLEKMKARKNKIGGDVENGDEARKFDNYGFLAKYCIFNKGSMESYRRTFESVDEEKRGWINGVEVMIGLRGINQNISYSEEEYLYRVLELTGYNVSQGADFKLFAVMAALSLKISSLDSWMKNMIGSMDFKTLDTKMYMCKKLWECNVDPDTNKIPIDQLCIELRAGGISPEHEVEVREKLGHLKALDLLDFLTYIPLFIMIHESVVDNPFDERREK